MRLVLAAALVLPLSAAAAQENFGAGSQAAPWLKLPNSARSASMGEAVAAVAEDANSISSNPAGLAGLSGQQVSLLHHVYVQDTALEHAAWGMGLGNGSGLGASFDFINFGSIEKTRLDPSGNLVSDGSINPSGYNLNLGYGRAFGAVSAGLNAKMVSQNLDGSKASSSFGADLGLLWKHDDSGLSLGAALQNAGAQLDGASLPMGARAGAAWRLNLSEGEAGLLFAADANLPTADPGAMALGLGAEYSGGQIYAVRAGYKIVGNSGASGFSAGAGLRYSLYGVDYAFVSQGLLGSSNQVSLSVKF